MFRFRDSFRAYVVARNHPGRLVIDKTILNKTVLIM